MWTSSETLIFTEKTYRSKNSPTCENAVARTHGSWMLRVMGSCFGIIIVSLLPECISKHFHSLALVVVRSTIEFRTVWLICSRCTNFFFNRAPKFFVNRRHSPLYFFYGRPFEDEPSQGLCGVDRDVSCDVTDDRQRVSLSLVPRSLSVSSRCAQAYLGRMCVLTHHLGWGSGRGLGREKQGSKGELGSSDPRRLNLWSGVF